MLTFFWSLKKKLSDWLFLAGICTAVIVIIWKGLFQPFYWDTQWTLIPMGEQAVVDFNLFGRRSFFQKSERFISQKLFDYGFDYPHTPLLQVVVGSVIALFPQDFTVPVHAVGVVFSLVFLVGYYWAIQKHIGRLVAITATVLLAVNPLFLAQTALIYFEIPSMTFRFLAFYFLIKKKYLFFTLAACIAFLFRVENGPLLIITLAVWLLLTERHLGWKHLLQLFLKYSTSIFLLMIWWILGHKFATGWWFISPYFKHEVDRPYVKNQILFWLTDDQGKKYLTYLAYTGFLLGIIKYRNRLIAKVIICSLFLTLPFLFLWIVIGHGLMRYTLAFLPVYFFLVALVTVLVSKNKYIQISVATVVLTIGIISQSQSWYRCDSNHETCLAVFDVIALRQQITSMVSKIPANSTLFCNWYESKQIRKNFPQMNVLSSENINYEDHSTQNTKSYILITPIDTKNQKILGFPYFTQVVSAKSGQREANIYCFGDQSCLE